MGITKCFQSRENIIRMAKAAFPGKGIPTIEELTEGMCNVAYRLTFGDGFRTILKIASPEKKGFLTNEKNLMDAEVKAMKLVAEQTDVKVAKVYAYDTSGTLCEGDYFFMECMEGENWITVYDKLEETEASKLRRSVGEIQRSLLVITNDKFGMLGDTKHRFATMYEFIYYLISNVLQDAENRNVVIAVGKDEILATLAKDEKFFTEVTTPTLIHWDMWEGNIFIKDGMITGVIDWERAMWGEPFMDEPFRHHKRSKELLEGFGIVELSEAELRRIYWYDILLYLTMITEVTYREYEDDWQVKWAGQMFDEVWEEI